MTASLSSIREYQSDQPPSQPPRPPLSLLPVPRRGRGPERLDLTGRPISESHPHRGGSMRAVIVGSGSELPPPVATHPMLARIMAPSAAWIRGRRGVETRHYVEPGPPT